MRPSSLTWCASLGLVACASSGPPAPGVASAVGPGVALDAGVDAAPIIDAATVDAAVDAPPVSAAEAARLRMRTPRSAQVNAEDQQRLAESRAKFDALARQHDGSYVYTAGFGSWTSADAVTTVRVRRGVVVERRFVITRDRGPGQPPKRLVSWTEQGAKVGSHPRDAEPAIPMDQHYDACARLIDLSAHWRGGGDARAFAARVAEGARRPSCRQQADGGWPRGRASRGAGRTAPVALGAGSLAGPTCGKLAGCSSSSSPTRSRCRRSTR